MENPTKQQSNWLAITSFILAIVWIIFLITIVFGRLWILCIILSLIFWIIAICKKQKPWAARIGTILSGIICIILTITCITLWRFFTKNSDKILAPIERFNAFIQENPDYQAYLIDNNLNADFQIKLQEKMKNLVVESNYTDWSDLINSLFEVRDNVFYEMENTIVEMAENNEYSIEAENENIDNCNCPEWVDENWDPFVCNCPTTWLANPASVYCEDNWGTLTIRSDESWDYWVCSFENGTSCEERAFYRGECGNDVEVTE